MALDTWSCKIGKNSPHVCCMHGHVLGVRTPSVYEGHTHVYYKEKGNLMNRKMEMLTYEYNNNYITPIREE